MTPEIEAIKHIGEIIDGKLVCRDDCPSVTHRNTPDTKKTLLDPTQPTHTGNLYGGKVIYKDTPDTKFETAIQDEWQAFLKLGGLHYTEEAQVMLQKIETYWQTERTSRDTYWKERVRKEVEGVPNATRDECYNEKVICADDLLQALDNLK